MKDYIKSNYSVEDLEKFRDEEGFIDLIKAGLKLTSESREEIGSQQRIKNWVDFNGEKYLIKGEVILDKEPNYGIYAELIVEEIGKVLGIPTAHYDLIKILDENGEIKKGVISKSVILDNEKEYLVSLHDIIGDEERDEEIAPDVTNLDFTIKRLNEVLVNDGYDKESIDKLIIEYKKRLLFSLSISETDKHTENVAFIKKINNDIKTIELAPNFDSESSLLCDSEISSIRKLLDDSENLRLCVNLAQPKIIPKISDDYDDIATWKDTLDVLCYDEEVEDYYVDNINRKVDMDIVLDNVESRIKSSLPEEVRLLTKYAYKYREEEMSSILGLNLDNNSEKSYQSNYLDLLINEGAKKQEIKTNEQKQISEKMEIDLDNLFKIILDNEKKER